MAAFFDLSGKVALVTGAGQGLGRAIALRLARAGARVAVNDLQSGRADAVADIAGPRAIALAGDAADAATVEQIFRQLIAQWGRIDVLVNNAGIVVPQTIFDTDDESWARVLNVNLTGPFLCTKQALARMRTQGGGGRIIMVGSMVGHQGAVKGWPHYGATKSGLHGLAKTVARTAAPLGVTVNVVAPGIIRTDMLEKSHGETGLADLAAQVPLGGLGDPEDVAAAVHYLASDDARYITGTVLDINGGLYIRA